MSRTEVLKLPNRTFWFMAGTIGRLLAESDIRNMVVARAAASDEGFETTRDRLVIEMKAEKEENPLEAKMDREGLNFLRSINGKQQ